MTLTVAVEGALFRFCGCLKINVKYISQFLLMGLHNLLQLYVWIGVIVSGGLLFSSAESTLLIHLHQAPPVRSNSDSAVFKYSLTNANGSSACNKNQYCAFHCELDSKSLKPCSPAAIELNNLTVNHKHSFVLSVTTHDGETNSSAYSWFIDTIPPTASISSQQNYTSAEKVAIDVAFSEACTGGGGFKCVNSSHCDVIINGPAHILTSSLRVIKPYIKYRLDLAISSRSTHGRVIVRMADKFCTDQAGNRFTRTNDSISIIRFDRRPVIADLWTSVPSYELGINGVPRTVYATNNLDDLKIFLDFSIPIMNSTEQVLKALHISSGYLVPVQSGNRRFAFELKNLSRTEIITVELRASEVFGMTGAPVSSLPSLAFLYDPMKPGVGLSSSSPSITKKPSINVIVEFTKPVFGFKASMMTVSGGKLIRFKDLSKALYSLTILAETRNEVSVTVPAGVVTDVSGNSNLASNQIKVKHYSVPAISIAMYSFMTAGIITTSLAAAILSLSSANLGAVGSLASQSTSIIASDPSMNINGMVGHLQVFVLSDWLAVNLPTEYSETTKGLRWLIPRHKLPWKKDSRLTTFSSYELPYAAQKSQQIDSKFGLLHGHHQNISIKISPYGLPLDSNEYFTYFLRGEPLSANIVVERMENYNGWQDLEMNLFWLGLGGGTLLIIHALVLLFVRWRTGNPAHGILSVPRFEIFLLILALPCISQSSTFVIRGGTTWGIITGSLLLAIPAAFIISVCLFLLIATSTGSFAQYKEVKHEAQDTSWFVKLWFFTARPVTGKWFYKEGLPSSFLPRFGILFENRKGPPLFVYVDQNDPNTIPKWTGSGHSGIGRMKAISSDDSNEESKITLQRRLLGCARSLYIIIDLVRRVSFGAVSGLGRSQSQSLIALAITLTQFLCLLTLKPYIRRGVHAVECISLLCEATLFGLSISISNTDTKALRILMLGLLFVTFVSHMVNEWCALIHAVLRLSKPHKSSLKLGLKLAVKGLVLPLLPRRHWPRIIPECAQPKTGLTSVPPLSPETEAQVRGTGSVHAMNATVVPVLSPGEPGLRADRTRRSTGNKRVREGQGHGRRGAKLEKRHELRKLRELAKASFSGGSKDGEGSSSYAVKAQSLTPETSSDENQASSSKINSKFPGFKG